MSDEIYLELKDDEWQFTYTDNDRHIVRAIVVDSDNMFYFVRVERDDEFGKATLIETSGGGVEEGEDFFSSLKRELKEELGAKVDILGKIGVVSDYYNLIHRHNIKINMAVVQHLCGFLHGHCIAVSACPLTLGMIKERRVCLMNRSHKQVRHLIGVSHKSAEALKARVSSLSAEMRRTIRVGIIG